MYVCIHRRGGVWVASASLPPSLPPIHRQPPPPPNPPPQNKHTQDKKTVRVIDDKPVSQARIDRMLSDEDDDEGGDGEEDEDEEDEGGWCFGCDVCVCGYLFYLSVDASPWETHPTYSTTHTQYLINHDHRLPRLGPRVGQRRLRRGRQRRQVLLSLLGVLAFFFTLSLSLCVLPLHIHACMLIHPPIIPPPTTHHPPPLYFPSIEWCSDSGAEMVEESDLESMTGRKKEKKAKGKGKAAKKVHACAEVDGCVWDRSIDRRVFGWVGDLSPLGTTLC